MFAYSVGAGSSTSTLVASDVAPTSDHFFDIIPGIQLNPGDMIVAQQTIGGDFGPHLPAEFGVEVMHKPRPEDLIGLFTSETLLECGGCLWVDGVFPGASVTLQINNNTPQTADTETESVKFQLPAGQRLKSTDTLKVSQVACGLPGNTISLAAPLAQARPEHAIAAPELQMPLVECQSVIRFSKVMPGAQVLIRHGNDEYRVCIGRTEGAVRLKRKLEKKDNLSISQSFPLCEISGDKISQSVEDLLPAPPSIRAPVCEGDRIIHLGGLFDDALVEIEADGEVICRSGASGANASPGVPSLIGRKVLRARQSVCGSRDDAWSDWSSPRHVRKLGPQLRPEIVQPLFAGGCAVGVLNVTRGALVQVVSPQGVIGEAYGNGDRRLDVKLWHVLVDGDLIKLRTRHCGVLKTWPDGAKVTQDLELRLPALANPLCDCGGSVLVTAISPGSIVEVFREVQPGSLEYLGGWKAGDSTASVDIRRMQGGEILRASQRRGAQRSNMSFPVPVASPPHWTYKLNSATRLCQLTQDADPGDRPHPVPTSQYGIVGTDLGVPVEHDGRLYLFFGDSAEYDGEADGDPIAWVTTDDPDELETEAPDVNWLLNSGGKFHWLSMEGSGLGNFEVPTGGFSYDGRLHMFVGVHKVEDPSRMTASFLLTRQNYVWDFLITHFVSDTTGAPYLEILPDGTKRGVPYPAGRWMLHISPTVVLNADWPGLPASTGEGLLMFASAGYRGVTDTLPEEQATGNVYLAWAPLTRGAATARSAIPGPENWMFLVGLQNATPAWAKLAAGAKPMPLLPAVPVPRLLGEISAVWYPELRRWVLAGSVQAPANVSRTPWGPWSPCEWLCDASRADRDAGNNNPANGIGVWTTMGVSYAPYLIRRWFKWDRSTRNATLYFTLSGFDDREGKEKYQPQLIRSNIECWSVP
ncbi:hypothetical protein [Methylobacterium nigriterrae]|uniref:hypothetical protein n=1 Tax=Methylobacterium nigriterrae TaxID=3127512 RepID=UPI0030132D33